MKDRCKNDEGTVLHLDATGNIIRRTLYVNRRILLCSAVLSGTDPQMLVAPVSDCLLGHTRTEDLVTWLTNFKCSYARVTNSSMWRRMQNFPKVICTDFSWAFIHAVLSMLGTKISDYLNMQFKRLLEIKPVKPQSPLLVICASHFIARVARTINIRDFETRTTFLRCFALIQLALTMEKAVSIWNEMVVYFGTPFISKDVEFSWNYLNLTLQGLDKGTDQIIRTTPS